MSKPQAARRCILALEDGTYFLGHGFGATGTRTGEVVFNTAMSGYQEVLTDPSYHGQIVTMTYPHVGNYGINPEDVESTRAFVSGFIVKELTAGPSNFRSTQSLDAYLAEQNVIGIESIDTRALTRKLRLDGAMRGVLTTEIADPLECVERARSSPSMAGADLVHAVAPAEPTVWTQGFDSPLSPRRAVSDRRYAVVAIDCGMKRNILRHLVDIGCEVCIVPPTFTPEAILERKPDGVFISNGPGDPAAVGYAIDLLRGLIGKTPIFGICLGHQLLALALGATSFKMKFGHRGANQPVRNLSTVRIEITSQNHGFAIDVESLCTSGGSPTHVNVNDDTLEGFIHNDRAVLAIQYHPEASPGPHDASYLFDCFATMMRTGQAPTADDMAVAQAITQAHRSAVATTSGAV